MRPHILIFLLMQSVLKGSWCQKPAIRITHLDVPSYARPGEDVKLRCFNSDPIVNSVKWFFNDEQFFRYMPDEDPPMEFFPPHDENGERIKINVDLSRSNATEIYLTKVKLSASGTYRCMATEDGPFFRDVSEEAKLTVTGSGQIMSTNKIIFAAISVLVLLVIAVVVIM